ncbi:RCC1 domain-containing protein [Leucobacter komagatae]|nr:hypothetical protein [Leucobacter komagatae]
MLASATIALTLFAPVSAALADPADEVAADSSMTVSPAKGTSVGGERVAIAPSQFDREWVHVGRGDYQSFAVTRDGSIYAWGSNRQGRLGIGSGSEYAQTPTRIPTPDGTPLAGKKFTQAEGGLMHGVALDTDGVVYTWGNNSYGQLGNGTHGLESSTISPVAVPTAGTPMAGKTIVKIATATYTTVVVASDGSVYGWGQGPNGLLGNGDTENSAVPVQVTTVGTPMAGKRSSISRSVGTSSPAPRMARTTRGDSTT